MSLLMVSLEHDENFYSIDICILHTEEGKLQYRDGPQKSKIVLVFKDDHVRMIVMIQEHVCKICLNLTFICVLILLPIQWEVVRCWRLVIQDRQYCL